MEKTPSEIMQGRKTYSAFPASRRRAIALTGSALLLLGVGLAPAAQAQNYGIVPIGAFEDSVIHVGGIGAGGVIAGSRTIRPGDGIIAQPWRWVPTTRNGDTGNLSYLPTFGGSQGWVNAVNDAGDAVGWADNGGLVDKPAFWPISGGISNLSSGRYSYTLTGLSDATSPIITAYANVRGTGSVPYYYKGGKWATLPTLTGSGAAHGVNDSGVVVGACIAADGTSHVVRWLPDAKGYAVEDLTSQGLILRYGDRVLINDAGVIVVGSRLLPVTGPAVSLPAPSATHDETRFVARALSSSGKVVGGYYEPALRRHCAFYFDGTTTVDVSTLLPPDSGWAVGAATGISDFGASGSGSVQIVGMGGFGGQSRAYLLTLP